MASIYDWSTTAANNGTADADVPWPEGMARRQVNDSARGIMKRGAELLGDIGGALSAGGTANGLTVTANSAFTTYADNRIIAFRATADNTGAATLNVNGIGAKAIRKMDNTGDVALAAGEIQNTGIYVVQYQTALNGAAGAWLLVNPTLSAAIYALSGLTTTDNAVARFDSTAGKLQNSGVIISDTDAITGVTSMTISGSAPVLFLTDTDTGADSFLSASSATGSILISADNGNESANSDIVFRIDGNALFTFSNAGNLAATSFSGSGTSLTALNASNLSSGTVPDARFPATLPAASGVNLTALNATQLTSGTVPSARISGSYTGITGTGALAAGSIASTFGNINVGSSTVTGGAASFTSMASSGQVTGTTAIFSSNLSAVGGTFSGAVSGTTGTFTGDVNTDDDFNAGTYSGTGASAGVFIGNDGVINLSSTGTGSHQKAGFVNGNGGVGSIVTSGSATTYNTASDGRRKKNLRDFDSGGFIDALEVWLFDWIAGGTGYGVIAQDAQKVFPDAIAEGEDGLLQADYSKFVPLLLAEVKALRARVAALEPYRTYSDPRKMGD